MKVWGQCQKKLLMFEQGHDLGKDNCGDLFQGTSKSESNCSYEDTKDSNSGNDMTHLQPSVVTLT